MVNEGELAVETVARNELGTIALSDEIAAVGGTGHLQTSDGNEAAGSTQMVVVSHVDMIVWCT